MKAAWEKLGGAKGKLGAAVCDQALDGDLVMQEFTGGTVSWDRTKNTFTTKPSNLASSLPGLKYRGKTSPADRLRRPAVATNRPGTGGCC